MEEANAQVHASVRIGTQRAENSLGQVSLQAFYWCRVSIDAEFSPLHEVTERILVEPDQFLDRLFWGRADPKAAMLLEKARTIEEGFWEGP